MRAILRASLWRVVAARSCCEEIFVFNLPLLSARARKDVEPKERRNLLRASC